MTNYTLEERLRRAAKRCWEYDDPALVTLLKEAADKIEELEGEVTRLYYRTDE